MDSKRRTFLIILLTQTFSMIGSRLTSVGIGIWVFQTTGNTTPLLLAAFFNELPGMLAGSIVGVWVDRWDRRKVLILADSGQALGSLMLFAVIAAGRFEIWHLYLVALVQGMFGLFQSPTQNAVTTLLIPTDWRERANALRSMSHPLAGITAPALAGLLFVLVGVTGIILIDLATFLVAVAAVALVHIPTPPISAEAEEARGGWWSELVGGLRFFITRRALLIFLAYTALINFMLNGPLEITIPYLIRKTGSEQLAGTILAIMSAGEFLGTVLMAAVGWVERRVNWLLGGFLLVGIAFLVYGVASSAWLLALSLFLMMVPLQVYMLQTSLLQVKAPPDLQGRIFGLIEQVYFLGSTSSFALTGWLVDHYLEPAVGSPGWSAWAPLVGSVPGSGMGLLLFWTGAIIIAATLLMFASSRIRHLERDLPDWIV